MSTYLSPNHHIYLYTNLNTLHTWHHQPTDISLQTLTPDCSQYQHLTLAAITSRSPSRYRMWRAFSLRPFTLSVSPLPTYISTVSCPGKFSHQPVHTHAPLPLALLLACLTPYSHSNTLHRLLQANTTLLQCIPLSLAQHPA